MSVTANGTTSLPPAITLNGASADKFVTGLLLLATWPLAKRSFAVTLLTALDVLDHGPMPVAAKNSSDNLARFFHKAASHSTSSRARPVPYYVVHALFAHLASRAIQATARSSSYGFGEVIFTAKSGYSILQTDFCHFLPCGRRSSPACNTPTTLVCVRL